MDNNEFTVPEENTKYIKDPVLLKYMNEFQDDVSITRFNIGDKSRMMSGIHNKWLMTLYNEKEYLKKAKNAKDQLIKNKTSNKISDSVLKMKVMEQVSNEDDEVKKYTILIERIKTRIDYLERSLNIFNNLVWYIKSNVEMIKMERG